MIWLPVHALCCYPRDMEVEASYSHKDGADILRKGHPDELAEVLKAIQHANAERCLRKQSFEKSRPPLLFSPPALNEEIKGRLHANGWAEPNPKSIKGFREPRLRFGKNQFREMDGIKNRVGLEVQFG